MSRLNYFTPAELMCKARDVMIPLENQLPAQQKIATIIGMHLARIQALNRAHLPTRSSACPHFWLVQLALVSPISSSLWLMFVVCTFVRLIVPRLLRRV